jgi:hypothetical protein
MRLKMKKAVMVLATVLLSAGAAQAFQFTVSEDVKGSLDTTATAGFGIRLRNPSPSLVGDPSFSPDANVDQWSNGDNGNLNYGKGDAFTAYTKLTPELLLKFPAQFKFMARGTFLYDFMANETHRTPLDGSARDQAMHDFRLLDLWVSKDFNIADQSARVRVGNQVISWGESIFGLGGINQTNALDIQKLLIPGTQLKEAVIPAPMVSFATGLGHGFNMEAYYQFAWNRNRLPPAGTYFSIGDIFDNGRSPFLFLNPNNPNFGGLDQVHNPTLDPAISIPVPILGDREPKNGGQFGIAFHYKPEGTALDLGAYFMNYHDKFPVLNNLLAGEQWTFLSDRQLYGLSANFPVGNWAVGMEASYRPKDAVALTGCFGQGGPLDFASNGAPVNCPGWIDEQKWQFHLTGILALTPGDHGWFLNLVGADGGYITAEAVDILYPNLKDRYNRTIDGQPVTQAPSAGYYSWKGFNPDPAAPVNPITGSAGTKNSLGYTVDFNLVYDGTIIPGWQVIPGTTFTHSVGGDTPTFFANYLEGAMSVNCYLLFNMNPAKWQAGINYTNWFGGDQLRQPLGDREFFGGFVSYNF